MVNSGKMFMDMTPGWLTDYLSNKGFFQISFVSAIKKKAGSTSYPVDDGLVPLLRNGGTSFASPQESPLTHMLFTNIIGRVYNDAAVKDMIVKPLFFALQPQGISMLADKRLPRDIKAQAAHITILPVGKTGGHQPS